MSARRLNIGIRSVLLLVRVAAEKALPFEPLNPNAETVAAMKAARRGELVKVGTPDKLALGA
jgi:DNA-damage-inducible protein J